MRKLVSNQICPELNFKDALYLLVQLPSLRSKKQLNFSDFFGTDHYLLTNTGRTALGVLITQLKLPKTKKIGLPAFCCCVMATPFLEAGYQIEWIDTDQNGLMDPQDFEAKAKKISLVIVPHIFGQKAPLSKISAIAQDHKIFMLEDCAHRLPIIPPLDKEGGRGRFNLEGWHADARLFSFGREKVVSCVSGGALVWNTKSPFLSSQVPKFSSLLPRASAKWTLQHTLQPLIYTLSLPWWFAGGKIIPWICQKLRLLPLAVTREEKAGREDIAREGLSFPHQKLLRRQINRLNKKIDHKEAMSKLWKEVFLSKLNMAPKDIITPDNYFRTIVKLNSGFKIDVMKKARRHGFYLREWDGIPISPKGVDLSAFGYQKGQCPKAEKFARTYLTLPTNQRVSGSDVVSFGKIFQ